MIYLLRVVLLSPLTLFKREVLTLETIKLDCTYEERVSKTTNNPYKCLVVRLSDDYEKIILMSRPEQALIESSAKKNDSSHSFDEFI